MSAFGHSQNNWGKNNPKCNFEKPVPGYFLYLALTPEVCIEIVCVFICFLRALVKMRLKQTALQGQKRKTEAFQTSFLHLSSETLSPVNASSLCLP